MTKLWDFHGGIHPPENKRQSLRDPIKRATIPPQLIFPLSQHIGAPATPLVAVGERVLKGQTIAEAVGAVSAPVHASTSGTVRAIEDRPVAHPSGLSAPCIVIDSDGADEWIAHKGVRNYRQLSNTALLEIIRNAGIAGMGGAGFPTAVKLGAAGIDTLVINASECEPYITSDAALLRERAPRVVAGVNILRHIIKPARTLIGVEDNKRDSIVPLQAATKGTDIEVVVIPTKYPSGGERQLIEILTGRQVPSGGLPADVGVVCQNIATALAVDDAVSRGEPLISRVTTVTGQAVSHPRNHDVLLGTPVRHLLERAGFDADRCPRLVMGGPMMGFTLTDLDVPVVKTTNCLLAPTAQELPAPPAAQACIRCGLCAAVCPASLLPQQLYWFAQGREYDKLDAHNLFDCIECGACSYVCPSNIPLVQYYTASKAELVKLRRDHAKSEHSRDRFEARQERLEREAAAREAKRAARKRARAAQADSGADPVQAAIERANLKKGKAAMESVQTDPATIDPTQRAEGEVAP